MKRADAFLGISLIILISSCASLKRNAATAFLPADYLTSLDLSDQPQVFAPEFISTQLYTRDIAMTPDGKEIYFSVAAGGCAFIMGTWLTKNGWSEPQVASFSGIENVRDFEPFISPDGKRFFFLSTRPRQGQSARPGWSIQNIWTADRIGDGWSEPYDLGAPVNTDAKEFFPCVTLNNTLYFTRSTGPENTALFRSEFMDGKYCEPEQMVFQNDSSLVIYNAFVAPDESFLIACVEGICDSVKTAQYYISYRKNDRQWSDLMQTGKVMNAPGDNATFAYVSPDGEYLFFGSSRNMKEFIQLQPGMRISEFLKNQNSHHNGSLNIWIMKTSLIMDLKQKTSG